MFSRPQLSTVVAIAAAVCLPAVVRAEPIGIAWRTNLDAAKLEAAQTGRLLLLHFYTQSCAPCRVLDQTVLNQPQVGAAVERDYVPVKVDADAQPALRNWFKITHVPAEVVLTPDGNVVATLTAPETPDAYIDQVQNLARHFRQTTPGAGGAAPGATVNSAYAGLPVSSAAGAAEANRYGQTAGVPAVTSYAGGGAASVSAPRPQGNPYMTGASAMGSAPTVAPPGTIASAGGPTMPTNAMPQSYRNPMFAGPPIPAGAAGAAGAAIAATPPTGAPTIPTTSQPAIATVAPKPAAAVTAPAPQVATAPAAQVAIAPPQGATVRPTQPPLPPNCPLVAFDGCCPVTLKTLNKWSPGNTAFGAIHRGRTYLFAGEQQRQQFLADPDAYSPVFAGYDPVLLLEKQQSAPGSRKYGFRYGGSFYLFSSRETMAKFEASPHTYAAGVRQAMARVDASTGGVVRR